VPRTRDEEDARCIHFSGSRLERVLQTLRLRFADRPVHDLAVEASDGETDPWELLGAVTDDDGRISLGDRESCTLEEVVDVAIVDPEEVAGPTWEHGLKDEDVATALDENYDPPPAH
jgi:hypothetical protein